MSHGPVSLPQRQRGITLIVGLIMLVLLLLMGISTFNLTRNNAAITANMQSRQEGISSAMVATEMVISSAQFTDTPTNALPGGCGANKACFDVNGDGTDDITVTLTPAPCIQKIQMLKRVDLNDEDNPDDKACRGPEGLNLGVSGADNGDTLCANTIWEINAQSSDAVTQASTLVTTGVSVRVPADTALDTTKSCP
jgi:Tfp pilus assembly protein PilX